MFTARSFSDYSTSARLRFFTKALKRKTCKIEAAEDSKGIDPTQDGPPLIGDPATRAITDAEGRPRLQDILAGRHSATSRRPPLLRGPTRTHGHHRRRASSPSVRARSRGANAAIKNGHEGTANKDHKNRFAEMRKKNHIHGLPNWYRPMSDK